MEAQEQANQIFAKFWEEGLSDRQAKECALIAVNYIINSNPHSNPLNTDLFSTMEYWQLVKTHIESL